MNQNRSLSGSANSAASTSDSGSDSASVRSDSTLISNFDSLVPILARQGFDLRSDRYSESRNALLAMFADSTPLDSETISMLSKASADMGTLMCLFGEYGVSHAVERICLMNAFRDSGLLDNSKSNVATEILEFWMNLPEAELDFLNNSSNGLGQPTMKALRLKQSSILGLDQNGSNLLVRPCYDLLWNSIKQEFDDPNSRNRGIFVFGDHGIGLKYFLVYIMYLVTQLNKSITDPKDSIYIIYEEQSHGIRYLLRPNKKPIRGNNEVFSFNDELRNPNNYYLYKCGGSIGRRGPIRVNCRTIVCAATDTGYYRDWLKESEALILFMPVWNRIEVTAAVSNFNIHTHYSKQIYLNRYEYYGGFARSIFSRYSKLNSRKELKNEITELILRRSDDIPDYTKKLDSALYFMEFPIPYNTQLLSFHVPEYGPFHKKNVTIGWSSVKIYDSYMKLIKKREKTNQWFLNNRMPILYPPAIIKVNLSLPPQSTMPLSIINSSDDIEPPITRATSKRKLNPTTTTEI